MKHLTKDVVAAISLTMISSPLIAAIPRTQQRVATKLILDDEADCIASLTSGGLDSNHLVALGWQSGSTKDLLGVGSRPGTGAYSKGDGVAIVASSQQGAGSPCFLYARLDDKVTFADFIAALERRFVGQSIADKPNQVDWYSENSVISVQKDGDDGYIRIQSFHEPLERQ